MNDILRIVAHACIHEPGRIGPVVVIQGELDDVFRAARYYLEGAAEEIDVPTGISFLGGDPESGTKAILVGARDRAVVRAGRFEGKVSP